MIADAVLGVVVIGRNEGERLVRCLVSAQPSRVPVVYVDSGSTDGSMLKASQMGAWVESLDMHHGFTAARARNVGWRRLLQGYPQLRYVQFVDGDCELVSDWLDHAQSVLEVRPECAGVCGRRRERLPEASVYNALCDLEWNTPVGDALATGGDAMFRVEALQAVGGFRDSLIAGEEPEMGLRMRALGWKLARLDHEMTVHDAALFTFGQWWNRSVRGGHAFAEGYHLHGQAPHRHYALEVRRIIVWAGLLPLLAVLASTLLGPFSLAFIALYPLQMLRLWRRFRRDPQLPAKLAAWHACLLVVGRFCEMQGLLRFYGGLLTRRRSRLIEYK